MGTLLRSPASLDLTGYIYNYRLYDYYKTSIMSLALLTDGNPNWRPNRFEQELWGCRVSLEFPVIKLLDYAENPVKQTFGLRLRRV